MRKTPKSYKRYSNFFYSRRPSSAEAHESGFRRRITVAIVISLAVNAVFFGAGGLLGHRFLRSLQFMNTPNPQDSKVNVRYLSPEQAKKLIAAHGAQAPRPKPTALPSPHASASPTPSPSPTPSAPAHASH